ncbi:MAG TPA: flavin oxidoreductase/NADH oxidase [Clostridiaceae bacterium]|nr:flavin oxidoreductase/NADH oxidase [Clostridiaceae bacterium]
MSFREFNYTSLDEVISDAQNMNINLDFSRDLSILGKKHNISGYIVPNSLVFHPMEGCDGNFDGSPAELTFRRYERFAKGGAGLLWFEATAVVHAGRAYPRQLWLNENNISEFQRLFSKIMSDSRNEFGDEHNMVSIMQLTHSGRFSKPDGKPAPVLACHNPYLDEKQNIDPDLPVISDDELERLEETFENAAVLAKRIGFHGVDIKCCHRYLNSGLLSAYTRKGRYGETFEGRTRFLLNIIDRIKSRLGKDFIATTRINIYDGIPYPYGWGVDKEDYTKPDFTEPVKLIKMLYDRGVPVINVTMGTPYYNPHVNRPYDKGGYIPEEHPLKGIARLVEGAAQIQKAVPGMAVVGTGYSWLRQFSPYLAAGSLLNGKATLIGYGRESFAYPDFAKDILQSGGLNKGKCCITCGKCTELMRAGAVVGCVVKDSGIYAPLYKEYVLEKSKKA